ERHANTSSEIDSAHRQIKKREPNVADCKMIPNAQYVTILPELVLSIVGIIIMLADPFLDVKSPTSRKPLGWLAFIGSLAALAATFYQAAHPYSGTAFFGMVRMDAFSIFFHVVVIVVSALAILSFLAYLGTHGIRSIN